MKRLRIDIAWLHNRLIGQWGLHCCNSVRGSINALMKVLLLWTVVLTPGQNLCASPQAEPQKPVIRVGGNADFAPFEFLDVQGRPEGYSIDLIRNVSEQMDLNIRIELGTWNHMRQQLESGQIDVLTGVLYSKERDRALDFSAPHLIFSYSVFVREDSRFQSIPDLKEKAAVVVKEVYAHDWLRTNDFTSRIHPVTKPQEALMLLSQGQYDFAVLPRLHGLDMLHHMKIGNLKTIGPPVLTQKFCFAVNAGNADLLAQLNEGLLLTQKSGAYDRIYSKWFSVYEQKHRLLIYSLWIFIPIVVLVLIVVLWNVSLKKTVAFKTREVSAKEAVLHQIVQGLPMPTFVTDRYGNVTHWNRACEALTGVAASRILGTSLYKSVFYNEEQPTLSDRILHQESADNRSGRWDAFMYRPSSLIQGGLEAEIFFSHLGQDGKWLFGTATGIQDESGQCIGAIESWQDLTEHKRLESQLIQSQKMEAIGTLAGGIAHDFSNILMAVMAHTEIVRRKTLEMEEVQDPLKHIVSVCDHGKNLIRRLMTISRQSDMNIQTVPVDQLINDTVDLVRSTMPSSIQIHRHINSRARVAVDITQLQQVVLNLCANAAHAMKGQPGELVIRLEDEDSHSIRAFAWNSDHKDYIKLTISDNGHGIPADILHRIFEPFFTTKTADQGTGMGLSVSHGIIKSFGGHITVESQPGKGTTFFIFLPTVHTPPATRPA